MSTPLSERTKAAIERAAAIVTHTGDQPDPAFGSVAPPIYQASLFSRKNRDTGFSYSRFANPTVELAELKIAALERCEAAAAFSSGMAAISTAILSTVRSGSHIVCVTNAYGNTRSFLDDYLERFKVSVTFAPSDTAAIRDACGARTSLIYLESPSSFLFRVQDLEALGSFARSNGILTICDNSWATPVFQNPSVYGIDLTVHSASKYLGGHSDLVAGVIAGSSERISAIRRTERLLLGGIMDPHQAWLLIRGMRTLPQRLERSMVSALEIADRLANHPMVERVIHPLRPDHEHYETARRQMAGGSGLFAFVPACGTEAAIEGIRRMGVFEVGPSWGGYESLAIVVGMFLSPEETDAIGVPPHLVRLSIGSEPVEALWRELEQALEIMRCTSSHPGGAWCR